MGNGTTDDTAALQAMLNTGADCYIDPPAVAYKISARLVPKSRQRIWGAGDTSIIEQVTWGETVFDCIGLTNVTVESLRAVSNQTRTWANVSGRGDTKITESCLVWANGDNITVRNCSVDGFYVGVRLTGWQTGGAWVLQKNAVIDGLKVSRVDFGVLASAQDTFKIHRLTGSYELATSSVRPPHLIYVTETSFSARVSKNMDVADCKATSGPDLAFQFKSVRGGTVRGCSSDGVYGLFGIFDTWDVVFSDFAALNDLNATGTVSISDEDVTRCTIRNGVITQAANSRAIRVAGTYNRIVGVSIFTNHTTGTASADVDINGDQNTIERVQVYNSNTSNSWWAFSVNVGEHRIIDPVGINARVGINVATGAKAIAQYDSNNFVAGATAPAFRAVATSTTTPTSVFSRPSRIAASSGGGATFPATLDASSYSMYQHTVTDTAAISVPNPVTNARSVGADLAVTIVNTSGSTSGAITWGSGYRFGATAPTNVVNSGRLVITFIWDGSVWMERGRSSTVAASTVTVRTVTVASSATPAIDADVTDVFGVTALTTAITSFTTNLVGTPSDGQRLHVYIVGTATRAITWGASFESGAATLPVTTVGTTRLDVAFMWNAGTSKWRCLAAG